MNAAAAEHARFQRRAMKEVTVYSSTSCDWNTREGRFFAALEYQGRYKYVTGAQSDTTADRCILTGFLEAIHLVHEPCSLTLVTAVRVSFNREGKPRGRNKKLKQLLLDMIKDKKCRFEFDEWTGGGDRLKSKLAEFAKVASVVEPADVVSQILDDDAEPPSLF
ncbi:MAG: hypothetical protein N2C14_30775 [Planctomycetales bacterium]